MKIRIVNLEKRKSAPSFKISKRAAKKFCESFKLIHQQLLLLLDDPTPVCEPFEDFIKRVKYFNRLREQSIKTKRTKGLKHRR